MFKKAYALGLFSFAAMGMIALPAQADTAVIQRSTQDMVIVGEDNSAAQVSEQINYNRRVNARTGQGSTGVVQDVYQGAGIVGEDNDAYQHSSQVNITEDVTTPRHRGQHRGHIQIRQR